MFREINYEDIDKKILDKPYILIDVRSPGEYYSETIPGAINIPIFDDDERKFVGTIYNNESVEKAKRLGIEIGSKKLPFIYKRVTELSEKYKYLIFFCSRGGFRSGSLVSLFKSLGVNAIKLNGGYKNYRRYINEHLPLEVENLRFVVLYGNTGTGKTNILNSLEKLGMDILDLEKCANHRGSNLGDVGLGKQNTQKMFESLIYDSLRNRKSDLIFVEGESQRIGNDIIPKYLYEAMNSGVAIKIEASMKRRIENLLSEYVHDTDDEIISSLENLRKHLGDKNVDNYIDFLIKGQYEKVIEELLIKYYDPMYEYKNRNYKAVFNNDDSHITAENIIRYTKDSLL